MFRASAAPCRADPKAGQLGASETRSVLGVRFFNGAPEKAVKEMSARGGLLVVPAAPALVNIQYDRAYRRALFESDLAIADSGFMVLLWRALYWQSITRVSGLAYLKCLIRTPQLRNPGELFLVVPTHAAAEKARSFLSGCGVELAWENCYVAPHYGNKVSDADLVFVLTRIRPVHIVIAIGGGAQEKLGLYLRETLDYRPAIHCIGAALGFLTGDQIRIPDWADRLYLGWLIRLSTNPRLYFRRFWLARELPALVWRYGEKLPPLRPKT